MNFDAFFDRTYNVKTCNCFDLVADFYLLNLGIDLRKALPAFTGAKTYAAERKRFKQLDRPENLCLCVFKPYNPSNETSHVGIYWNGEVFHIDEAGVKFSSMPFMSLNFKAVRFYEYVRSDNQRHFQCV